MLTTYAVFVFAMAAVAGLLMANRVLRGKLAPWPLSLTHALLGATGLIILLVAVLQGQAVERVTAALAMLLVAAMGGFYLASIHLRGSVAPQGVVVIHAGVAVVGFLTLLTAVLGMG